MADIDLSSVCNSSKNWTPITTGRENTPYLGVFDGNGHTISGLYAYTTKEDYQGLFAYVGNSVMNLNVDGIVVAKNYAGIITARLYKSGKITNCKTSGVAAAGMYFAGGIAGHTGGTISDCENHAMVTAFSYGGGIAGQSEKTITRSMNYGTITVNASYAGGITGYSSGTAGVDISYCANVADISASYYAGGIVGGVKTKASITGSWNYGKLVGYNNDAHVGSLVGDAPSNEAVTCTNSYYNIWPAYNETCITHNYGTSMSANGFSSGTLASMLGRPWGQNINYDDHVEEFPTIEGLYVNGFTNRTISNVPIMILNMNKNGKYTKSEIKSFVDLLLNK